MRLKQARLDGGVNVPVQYVGGTEGWRPCPGPHPIRGHSWLDGEGGQT